jgi:hypothetical protein
MSTETLTALERSFRVRIMTTSQAADLYLGELARQGRTQRTIQSYRRTLHKLADSYPHHDVEELTASMLRVFLDGYQWNRKTGKGLNRPATIAQAVTIVRCFFKWLHEEELVQRDPAERLRRPKLAAPYENDNVVTVSSEDVRLMLLAAEGWQEKIAVSLAVYSGGTSASPSLFKSFGKRSYLNLVLNHNYVTEGALYVRGYFAGQVGRWQFHWTIGHRLGRFLFGVGVPCRLGWHPDWFKREATDV